MMNYGILCNEILKLDSKIRFAGVFNSRGESAAEKDRDVPSLLSTDETKMLVHYTFARWRHLQNLEHRLGKARTSVTRHEKVTLISLYLGSDLLLLSIEPDYNHTKIVKKIRTLLENGDGTPPSKKRSTVAVKRKTATTKAKKKTTAKRSKPVSKAKRRATLVANKRKRSTVAVKRKTATTKAKKKTTAKRSKPVSKAKRRATLVANKRKRSTVAVKRKTATTKAKKKTTAKRSKPVSKAKRRATLVANKRKRELEKANNKIKSLKKAIRLAEKSAKKKKTIYQQTVKRVSQTR